MRRLKLASMFGVAAMTAMTVTAVIMSAHMQYDLIGQEMRVNQNNSAEVFKVHANVHAAMSIALDQPSVPTFVVPPLKRWIG